jgi:hypothetical protein
MDGMTTSGPPDLDASLFPASYRAPLWKGLLRVAAYFLLFILALFGRAQILRTGLHAWFMIYIAVLGTILMVVVSNAAFARVVLYPDRIERITWFGKRALKRDQVKSLRRRGWGPLRNNVLISKTAYQESILLPHAIQGDRTWDAWMTVAQPDHAVTAPGRQTAS